ncbi:MAG TPA: glycosyl transferase family 2, partial [Candidatus Kerfeldbacteria bacterium]|nr:glycosyl transferase family 2 [Candidatus Kerfeldbacteria bacterium]
MTPTVSIVILTYNSARHLPALFESLHDQTYQSLEIIVVDNASSS